MFFESFENFLENGFQIYNKRSHKLFLYILRNKYGLKVLKVTDKEFLFIDSEARNLQLYEKNNFINRVFHRVISTGGLVRSHCFKVGGASLADGEVLSRAPIFQRLLILTFLAHVTVFLRE